jgi:hypothetical protein
VVIFLIFINALKTQAPYAVGGSVTVGPGTRG